MIRRYLWLVGALCLSQMQTITDTAWAQNQTNATVGKQSNNQAVVTPSWSKLQAVYDYDAKAALTVKEVTKSTDKAYMLHIEFDASDNQPGGKTADKPDANVAGKTEGKKVEGVFARPKAEGIYPVVLLLHGLTSDKETMMTYLGNRLVEQGIAVLALDAPYHGERKQADINPGQPTVFPGVVRQGCLEWRHGLDYLMTRKDIDKTRVGLLGYSMGSMMGSILGAVDKRIGSFALCVAGDPILPVTGQLPDAIRDPLFGVCPSLFIGHIAPRPLLMLNGKQDTVMPAEASNRLYAAAKEPKEQAWFDSGHILPPEAGLKAITWLTKVFVRFHYSISGKNGY